MTVPFSFSGAYTTRAPLDGSSGTKDVWNPLLTTSVFSSNGFSVLLNGRNLNRRLAELVDSSGDDDEAVYELQMHASKDILAAFLSGLGTGQVYGTGLKWRYRYRNSQTGEVSGMTPIPDEGLDVGAEVLDGSNSYLGQTAYFRLSVTDAPNGADRIQLIRNTSGQDDVWYVVDDVALSSVTEVSDDTPDELLVFNELASLYPTPSWEYGRMPPMVKAYAHPTGRTMYYGVRRMGVQDATKYPVALSGTVGDVVLTLAADATNPRFIEFGREGQRVRFGTDADRYRIVRVVDNQTLWVYPELEQTGGNDWVIEDDRDSRAIYMSEPGLPWCVDPFKTVYVGQDTDDDLYHIFSLGGRTFAHTKRRIYAIVNDYSEDPSLTMQVAAVSEEGTTGFWAGCNTPFGWVYLHPTLGVRVFDGSASSPLGGEGSYDDFIARAQIDRIEPSMLAETRVYWDDTTRQVFVSYVPTGEMHHKETLTFSAADRNWRGPHHQSLVAFGTMRSAVTDEVPVFGDDYGHLYENGQQALDLLPYTSGLTLTGSIASVSGLALTVTSATFDPNSDLALRGAPVWLADASGVYYKGRILNVPSATVIQLEGYPVDRDGNQGTPAAGWTFSIGAIRWYAETAYIDGGEPIQPKTTERIRLRWERPTASNVNSFTVGDDGDDIGSFGSEDGTTTEKTIDPENAVYGDVRLRVNGVAHKLRFYGLSRDGHPKITTAVLDMDIRSGVRRNA